MGKQIIAVILISVALVQGCAKNKKTISEAEARSILEERLRGAQMAQEKNKNGTTFTTVRFAGSLKPNADLGCVPVNAVSSKINPPALVYAAKKCIQNNEYKKAWGLLSIGSGFAYYDLKRLADKSTSGAWRVLNMNAFANLTKEQRDKYQAVSREILASPNQKKSYCDQLKKIGAPTYEPKWAILHGIGAYKEPRNGDYLANVKPEDVWGALLKKRCSTVN